MNELIIYRILFATMVSGAVVEVQIQDLKNYDPENPFEIRFVDLVAGVPALKISTYNNEEDIFSPIIGKRADITFKNTSSENMHLFSSGDDHRYFVKITYQNGGKQLFTGWLVQDDISEPYLPAGNSVTLVALDQIALQKGKPLRDFEGNKPKGKYSLIKIAAWCLAQTGLQYDIIVADNLFETRHADRDAAVTNGPWHQTYLDVLTFEADINEFQSYYDVLKKILISRRCRIVQHGDAWWIVRLDEYRNLDLHYTKYNKDGNVLTGAVDFNIIKPLGHQSAWSPYFINASSLAREQRPYVHTMAKWDYAFPKEMPLNTSFERGANDLISSFPGFSAFHIEDWELKHLLPASGSPLCSARILREFDSNGYETQRYVVITQPSATTRDYLESSPIELCKRDKFELSFDWRWSEDRTGGGSLTVAVAIVRLEAEDNTFYTLDDDGSWFETNSSWSAIKVLQEIWQPNDVDESEWRNFSRKSDPLPKKGKLYIMLHAARNLGLEIDRVDVHFADLKFTHRSFLNGAYWNYKGENYKAKNNRNLSAMRNETMWLADAVCNPFKGAMFLFDDPLFLLTEKWNDWALLHDGQFAGLGEERFLKWMAFDMYNQHRKDRRLIEYNLKGLNLDTTHCDMIHRYHNQVNSPHNKNKWFLLLHMEQDIHREEWRGTMIEVNDVTDRREYGDGFEFKYVQG